LSGRDRGTIRRQEGKMVLTKCLRIALHHTFLRWEKRAWKIFLRKALYLFGMFLAKTGLLSKYL
jgi:hypothetical protein